MDGSQRGSCSGNKNALTLSKRAARDDLVRRGATSSVRNPGCIEALTKVDTILDFVAVEKIVQSNKQYAIDQFVEINGDNEPVRLSLQDNARLKAFPGVRVVGYNVFYSDHPDLKGDIYPSETAIGTIFLLSDKECVNRDKVISRYGQPDHANHYENGESSYSWNIVHDKNRLIILSLQRVSDTSTNDEVMPPWNVHVDSRGFQMGSPRKSECEQIGVQLKELRPHYHFRDVPAEKDITLIDRVTLHPPTAKMLTRDQLSFTYKGDYPKHGVMLSTGGFMMYSGSDWVIADLDRLELHCVHQTDGRSFGQEFRDDISGSLSKDQTKEIFVRSSDAKAGKDPAKRKTQIIADQPVNSVVLFDGDHVLQADDDGAFFALPRMAELLNEFRQTSCTGKAVRTPTVSKPAG